MKNLKVSWYRPTSTSAPPVSSPVSLKIPIGTLQEQADTVNSSQIYGLLQLQSRTNLATESIQTHVAPHGSIFDSHRSYVQFTILFNTVDNYCMKQPFLFIYLDNLFL